MSKISPPPQGFTRIDSTTNFAQLLAQHLDHDSHFSLLGPPIMRGAIVFSGSSHPTLVDGICDRLGMKRGIAALSKFANGETQVQIHTSVRDKDVFIVQSGSAK
jgi:ribose-phosphate pyrophosphokinase